MEITAILQAERLTGRIIPADISMRDFGALAKSIGCRVVQRGFDLVLVPVVSRVA